MPRGDVVFYNYNFLGGPFAPPYDHLVVTFNFANVAPGAVLSLTFFDGPNGTGLFFFGDSEPVPPALLTFNAFGFGAAVDGVFSVRIQAAVSPWELLSTTATAFGSPSGPPLFTVTGTIAPTATAPEPATVVLLVSGVAAGLTRRVRKPVGSDGAVFS